MPPDEPDTYVRPAWEASYTVNLVVVVGPSQPPIGVNTSWIVDMRDSGLIRPYERRQHPNRFQVAWAEEGIWPRPAINFANGVVFDVVNPHAAMSPRPALGRLNQSASPTRQQMLDAIRVAQLSPVQEIELWIAIRGLIENTSQETAASPAEPQLNRWDVVGNESFGVE